MNLLRTLNIIGNQLHQAMVLFISSADILKVRLGNAAKFFYFLVRIFSHFINLILVINTYAFRQAVTIFKLVGRILKFSIKAIIAIYGA